jgi:uracil-DNA glycosylase family 4
MRYVNGEGPVPSDLMFIGERPGKEENAYGRPFVGKPGKELDRYLWDALHRHRTSVYVTNLCKTYAPGDADPTEEEIRRDAVVLEDEIRTVDPAYVVTLGRFSTRYFIPDADMEVVHGYPRIVGGRCVCPVYHPAAGLHSTEFQGLIAWDFERLAQTVRGEIEPGVAEDEYPEPEYIDIKAWVAPGDAAVDTEGSIRKPWCLTFSTMAGIAACSRNGDADFRHIILHNAMHDLGVLRAMDTRFESFDDTMVMAYLLCLEPQGLKALAKRHCGMEMQEYSELVGPYDDYKKFQWLQGAVAWLSKHYTNGSKESSKTSQPGKRPRSVSAGRRSGKTSPKTTASRKR